MSAVPPARDLRAYEDAYATDYDFEAVQVRFRREAVLRCLLAHRPRSVVEIGCGLEPLLPHYLQAGGDGVARWIVAEPADRFAAAAREVAALHPGMHVYQGLFEDVAPAIVAAHGAVDLVVCSGLLHEVPDPAAMLRAICGAMAPGAVLHLNVPNALSLHRRLAVAMGLIREPGEFSARNLQMQHQRVYSPGSLRQDVESAGLRVAASGGIFLKPFTHAQMQGVVALLGSDILPGLAVLGAQLPELASEIYVDAVADGA